MKHTIFFSWQSDTPSMVGRAFIERALDRAVGAIGLDSEVEEAVRDGLEIDRDTKGVSRSPPIVDTIFKKIDNTAVFVADLTFAGKRPDGAPIPNPNVLIEYGWALKSLGHGRIVSVMNTAFGNPSDDEMPFDMRHLRHPIQYDCPASADDETRTKVRAGLAKQQEGAIKTVINSDDFKSSLPKPPVPPRFVEKEPLDGLGRFRARGQPLGVSDHHAFLDTKGYDVTLTEGPAIWLRVMPSFGPGQKFLSQKLRQAATETGLFLIPLGTTYGDYGFIRAEDGFGIRTMLRERKEQTCGVVFAFNTGEVWGVDTYLVGTTRGYIPLEEGSFSRSLEEYSSFLSRLGVEPPYRWIAGIEGVKGRGLHVPTRPGYMSILGSRGHCVVDALVGEGNHAPGDDARQSLRPFFDYIYDSCGLERPDWLNG